MIYLNLKPSEAHATMSRLKLPIAKFKITTGELIDKSGAFTPFGCQYGTLSSLPEPHPSHILHWKHTTHIVHNTHTTTAHLPHTNEYLSMKPLEVNRTICKVKLAIAKPKIPTKECIEKVEHFTI